MALADRHWVLAGLDQLIQLEKKKEKENSNVRNHNDQSKSHTKQRRLNLVSLNSATKLTHSLVQLTQT